MNVVLVGVDHSLLLSLARSDPALRVPDSLEAAAKMGQTLRSTPAMKAGVADHVWTIEEMVGLLRP